MNSFSQVLKFWRQTRRFSQLQLALEADVSSRHISFLETGRSRPSADMITRLGDALRLPLDARNRMLTLAGFAAKFGARPWDAAEMAPIRAAVDHMLQVHAPYPGLVLDREWSIVQMNAPAQKLYGMLQLGPGDSLLDLLTSPALPPLIENWDAVAAQVVQRLRTESAAQGGIAVLDRTADQLATGASAGSAARSPVVPTVMNVGGMRLSMFATIAQFGTPQDVTLQDLKVELYFPSDAQTTALLRGLTG